MKTPEVIELEKKLAMALAALAELNKRVTYLERENRRRRTENNKG